MKVGGGKGEDPHEFSLEKAIMQNCVTFFSSTLMKVGDGEGVKYSNTGRTYGMRTLPRRSFSVFVIYCSLTRMPVA